jgi:hypothetical protein
MTTAIEAMQLKLEQIRTSRKYTPESKRNQIAEAYLRAARTVQAERDNRDKARTARVESLRRTVYGRLSSPDGPAAVADRDARDRVARIDTNDQDEALQLLADAEFGQDTSLTRALVARAYDAGWADVLNAYSTSRPALEPSVDELWELTTQSERSTLEAVIRQEADLDVPIPPELEGKSRYAIEAMASNGASIEAAIEDALR